VHHSTIKEELAQQLAAACLIHQQPVIRNAVRTSMDRFGISPFAKSVLKFFQGTFYVGA